MIYNITGVVHFHRTHCFDEKLCPSSLKGKKSWLTWVDRKLYVDSNLVKFPIEFVGQIEWGVIAIAMGCVEVF